MKLLATGDWHLRGSSPRNRKDDYKEAVKQKLYEIFNLAAYEKVTGIICPGDIWDRPEVSNSVLLEFAEVLNNSPVPIWATSGNHDVYNYNIETYKRTSLKVLELLVPKLHVINDNTPISIVSDLREPTVRITFSPFDNRIDKDGYGYSPECEPSKTFSDPFSIHVAHGMLLDHEPPFDRYTLLSDVKTSAHIVISGHCHTGFGVFRRSDGKVFINPGAIGRLSASTTEIERPIQVALIEIRTADDFTVTLIPIQAAKPGDEVLDRSGIEAEEQRQYAMEEFTALIQTRAGSKVRLNIDDVIETIAKQEGVGSDVVARALSELATQKYNVGA